MSNAPDTHSYKGWMNSDSFLKRAFGVLGHNFVAALIIEVVLFIILMLIGGTALLGQLFQK